MSRKITPAHLDEIEAAARAALIGSPHGWTAHREDGDYDYSVDTGGAYLGGCPDCGTRPGFDKEDATHIATFDPSTTLALVAEVRELRAKVALLAEAWQEGWDAAHETPWTDGPTNPYREEA